MEPLFRDLQAKFMTNRSHYNIFLDELLIEEKDQVRELIRINNIVDSILNCNVYAEVIKQEYGCFECKDNLVSEIVRAGFREKYHTNSLGEVSRVYFAYGLVGLDQLLDEVRVNTPEDMKLLGSYYSRMAELYIELNNVSKACECIENYQTLWPDAYNVSAKKNYYDNNCVK